MPAVGAIAFRRPFEARVNRAGELHVGLRRERCGGVGAEQWGRVLKLGVVERNNGSRLDVHIENGDLHLSVRTIARIRQNADQEH